MAAKRLGLKMRARIALALPLLGAGVLLALAVGASPLAIAAGLALGIGAAVLLWPEPAPERPPEPAPSADQPRVEELMAAFGDPLLLVEGRMVIHANTAAREALGPHVEGEDVRLAIRHPAAAELLVRRAEDKPGQVDLVGLGDRDRPWTLSTQPLGRGLRLVRLVDRSEGRAAERMRVDFVANASHELRTPLASLIGFIETLEDANGPEDAPVRARFLKIMAGEARRMQRLVEDLMSLSRIEADRHRAPAEAVALVPLAREVADAFGVDVNHRRRIRIEAGTVPAVAGDRAQLSQLLHNLIGNALKYGDAAKPVRVVVTRLETMVRLSVADEGEGIAPQHLPRLTERFYRVDASRSRAIGGTGLGLAIVKHIVERHRGRLDIASVPGRGTEVTVLLPIAQNAGETPGLETPPGALAR
ncbi:sensor histidine kinase [Sphingomonas morindae]|uniref:histidine kinase n=1 Tax=Sphingomonas morindae TaxID=1541170 RepID=A0ABY4XAX8_9SPHN|nr:ATP-binding protein [Sphingomonas morindae]USI74110.1 ATPase [Sphingomonas morindae]